jgi:hypothetical protein
MVRRSIAVAEDKLANALARCALEARYSDEGSVCLTDLVRKARRLPPAYATVAHFRSPPLPVHSNGEAEQELALKDEQADWVPRHPDCSPVFSMK